MIDAINCNGNFGAGFMRCLHGRNDAFFTVILRLSFCLKSLFKIKLKRSLRAKFCWKFFKNSHNYLYIFIFPLKGSKWMTKLWKLMASVWLVLRKILLQLFLETPKGKSGEYFRRKKIVIEYFRLPSIFHRSVSMPRWNQSFLVSLCLLCFYPKTWTTMVLQILGLA